MGLFYDPKTALAAASVEYMVSTTGDRLFIPFNADYANAAAQLASTQALSPRGVERVA